MATTTRDDLVAEMALAAGIPKNKATQALEAVLRSVMAAMIGGRRVTLVGFGSFAVAKRKGRLGVNPRTKKKIAIGPGAR